MKGVVKLLVVHCSNYMPIEHVYMYICSWVQ